MKLWLRSVGCGVLLLWALVVQAHDGPHGPDALLEMVSAKIVGTTVAVKVRITNLGGPLVLVGMRADGAAPIRLDPVYLNFAEDQVVSGVLDFRTAPFGAFSLGLDFGVVGQGRVTVVPSR